MTIFDQLIIEPEQFAKISPNANLRIVDLGSAASYTGGHVPGAVHCPPQALMLGQPPAPGKLAELAQLQRVFAYLGHTPETHYLVYDDEGGGWAGRFIWTLDVIGHRRYTYLNGGIHAWRAAGLPLETDDRQVPATNPEFVVDRSPIAEIEDILPRLGEPDFAIWDARSAPEYRGEKVFAQKGGHIPGAVHCEWTELMDPARHFRIHEDAEEYLRSKGLTRNSEIITHCQSHHRSGFTYLVGKSLGFNIRAYHGSWSEWGNHPETPVEV